MSADPRWYATVALDAVDGAAAGRRAVAFSLLGQKLALWRGADGGLVALEDRCAHQDAEISGGICRDGVLICPSHGWTHEADGTARPPGARNWKTPPNGWRKVAHYRVAAYLGFAWVSLGEPSGPPRFGDVAPDATLPADARRLAVPAERLFEGAMAVLNQRFSHAPHTRSGLVARAGADSTVVAVTPMTPETSQLVVFATDAPARLGTEIASALAREPST